MKKLGKAINETAILFGKAIGIMIICLIVIGIIGGTARSIFDSDENKTTKNQKTVVNQTYIPKGMLPGIKTFLLSHSEFGKPISVYNLSDWHQGRRQRIQFISRDIVSENLNLLFYLKGRRVITVKKLPSFEIIWEI